MAPVNANGASLVGSLSIGQFRMSGGKFENLDTHYFDRDDHGTQWVWSCRPAGGDTQDGAKAGGLFELLVNFLEVTDLGEHLLIVIKTNEGDAESSESLCKADVLKLIAPRLLDTEILNVVVDGESHAARRLVRWGPTRDSNDERTPAAYLPLIPEALFVEFSEPLISNVAMTDWHEGSEHWHLWETLYKSGDNYMLFQSELGHDDQMYHMTSSSGIPVDLLSYARSFEISTDESDHELIDHWGQLIISDRGRELLP